MLGRARSETPQPLDVALGAPWPVVLAPPHAPVPSETRVDAIVVDLDSLDADEARGLADALSGACAPPPVVAVSSDLRPPLLRTLLSKRRLRHICQRGDEAQPSRRLEGTLTRLVGPRREGLAGYLGPQARLHQLGLTSTSEREAALAEVEAEAHAQGVSRRVRQVLRSALDELIMNAMYDAPVDAAGALRCASLPRTTPVRLEEHERVEVHYGSDGERFGVSVVDPFGSLRPERAQDEVARWLAREPLEVREGPGGAGIGLQEVLDVLEHLVIDLQPGLRTEIIGLFGTRGGFRRIRESSKSVDIFVREGAA